MKTKSILLVFLLLVTQSVFAQIMFQSHYGGTADDFGCKVIQTSDNGYFVAAITESYGAGYRDIFLIRTNEFGDTLWTKTIGGLQDDQPNAMKKLAIIIILLPDQPPALEQATVMYICSKWIKMEILSGQKLMVVVWAIRLTMLFKHQMADI